MTYSAIEASSADGSPVELYTFARGLVTWRYTSAQRDIEYEDALYEARVMDRDAVELSTDAPRSAITVRAQRDIEVAELLRITPPTDVITLTIRQLHLTDPDAQAVVVWQGRVLSASWSGPQVSLRCEPVYTSIRRPGLRRLYQRQCPHVLYGPDCGVLRGAYARSGTVSAVSGTVLTIDEAASQPDGYYAGGMLTWEESPGVAIRRMIVGHEGASITLTLAIPGLAAGAQVELLPGCDHTLATCDQRFSNAHNYGGFPWIPQRNPFGSDPIY